MKAISRSEDECYAVRSAADLFKSAVLFDIGFEVNGISDVYDCAIYFS